MAQKVRFQNYFDAYPPRVSFSMACLLCLSNLLSLRGWRKQSHGIW